MLNSSFVKWQLTGGGQRKRVHGAGLRLSVGARLIPAARFIAMATALLALLGVVRAAHAEVGDELTVSVLTFGPGDHPFTKFGHTAVLVENTDRRTRLVYNYGTFAFDSVWLIPNFLRGNYRYWLSVQPLDATLAAYEAAGRWVMAQRLHLTASEKRSIVSSLEYDARPENKYYAYDYYDDNCVTRVRDKIDRWTGGVLLRAATMPADLSLRQHTSALTNDTPVLRILLSAALSSPTDRPRKAWDEMFLPAKLLQWLRRARVRGATSEVPLVDAEIMLVPPKPKTSRDSALMTDPGLFLESGAPQRWTFWTLSIGMLAFALLRTLAGLARRGQRAAGVLFSMALGIVGLTAGLLGSLFLFLWVATRHTFAFHNENLLQCPPFALLLVVPAFRMAADRAWHGQGRLKMLVLLCLGSSLAGICLKALPWFCQDNTEFMTLWVPVWAGCTLGLAALAAQPRHRSPTSPSAQGSG